VVAVLAAREPGDELGSQQDSGGRSASVVGDFPLDADPAAVAAGWDAGLQVSLE
jgi:hypothetical protein